MQIFFGNLQWCWHISSKTNLLSQTPNTNVKNSQPCSSCSTLASKTGWKYNFFFCSLTAHCKSRNQESSSDLLLRDRSYLHQLKWFQLTVYNELEVQTFKQLFYQHEFSVKLKLEILGWIFWFVISLIFFAIFELSF